MPKQRSTLPNPEGITMDDDLQAAVEAAIRKMLEDNARPALPTDLLDAAARLKVVGRAGIGVDNIDIAAATARWPSPSPLARSRTQTAISALRPSSPRPCSPTCSAFASSPRSRSAWASASA